MTLELPEELRLKAQNELNETPERRASALQELRQKLELVPNEKRPAVLDDTYLVSYLRPCKFDVNKAFAKVMAMAKFLKDNEAMLRSGDGLKGEQFRDFYSKGFLRCMHGRTREGAYIACLLPGKMDFAGLSDPDVFLKWNVWSMDRMINDPYLQVNGMVMVENFKDFSLLKAMRMQTSMPFGMMRKSMHFLQECLPYRLKGLYIMNQPSYVNIMWALVKPFASKKFKERIRWLGADTAALNELIDTAVLPPEFGGTLQEDPMAWLEKQIELEKGEGVLPGAVDPEGVKVTHD